MKILPINSNDITYKRKMKIPVSSSVTQNARINDIQALDFAVIFSKFEEKYRAAMKKLVYMVHH